MVNESSTKEARVYNGEKTVSLASGVGKAGQLLVNQHPLTIHKNKFEMA